ncbi:OmpA family protein [uncultured Pseudoteredinibacter sp.]|uniref:OmpA family protein n=1 Tax=uncultured Pseudoteredinibacter sp. TaxID=1641701 RepID=UPI002632DEA5|nr:OmpA family protein [uncultured Pseudoteredinibacter sp.]
MKNFQKCTIAVALGVAASAMSVVASAQNASPNHKFEAYMGANKHYIENDRGLKNGSGKTFGLGYVVNENWTIEGMINDFSSRTKMGGLGIDGRHLRLDAVYNLARSGSWQPFFVGGAGDQSFDIKGGDKDKETALNLGAGTKYFLNDNWAIRGDVRAIHSLDEEATDLALGLGVAYLMGATAAPQKLDSDGDTVEDSMDQCPNTPAGVAVDGKGCALDSDRDGVFDYGDLCPNTPMGTKVDKDGCPEKIAKTVSIELEVNFDTDSATVKQQYMSEIKDVAEFMKQYNKTNVELAGHTDSTASEAYNQALSNRRASAVAKVLVETFDVEAGRVTATGYGEARPVADNSTAEGRAANRRVVAEISTETVE